MRAWKRKFNKNLPAISTWAILLGVAAVAYAGYEASKSASTNPVIYKPLLQLIAEAESRGNYNAYFGNAGNSSIDFTAMSIGEVLAWQADFVAQGNPSSAVGRYQIINTTLDGLVRELNLDKSEKFDEAMQDRMAVALLERRGAEEYVNDNLSSEQFAANLAQEWAALPKVIGDNPEESYYASDGLNRAHVRTSDILATIKMIEK